MANLFKKEKFVELCLSSESFQIEALRQACENNQKLFDHIMYEVDDMKDLEQVSTDVLLQIADQMSFYLGGEPTWKDHVRTQVSCLENAPSRRMRPRVL